MRLELTQNSYLLVKNFINKEEAQDLADQFFMHEVSGLCEVDSQAPKSSSAYNFMPFLKLLVKKVSHVSELIQEDVLPTYTYARIYKYGEVLDRHRDRDACEISITLNLAQDKEWPIYIQKPSNEEVSLNLKPGDAMLYLGCIADHWRHAFTGNNHTQVFMHYVRANGPCAYAYFDRERK
jgi:hypothetical protein